MAYATVRDNGPRANPAPGLSATEAALVKFLGRAFEKKTNHRQPSLRFSGDEA
jgi:hypothetical protein